MDHIGIDVHKKASQLCILREDGELSEQRIRTAPARFAAVLGERPRGRVLLEASTESEWVARCLEGLGREVIVADPNVAPMYAARTRKVKTDRRDARALAEACRLGAYRGRWVVPPRFVPVGSGLRVPQRRDGLMAGGDRMAWAKCGTGPWCSTRCRASATGRGRSG